MFVKGNVCGERVDKVIFVLNVKPVLLKDMDETFEPVAIMNIF